MTDITAKVREHYNAADLKVRIKSALATIAPGWRDLPFWWQVIVAPDQAITSVFASATPGTP